MCPQCGRRPLGEHLRKCFPNVVGDHWGNTCEWQYQKRELQDFFHPCPNPVPTPMGQPGPCTNAPTQSLPQLANYLHAKKMRHHQRCSEFAHHPSSRRKYESMRPRSTIFSRLGEQVGVDPPQGNTQALGLLVFRLCQKLPHKVFEIANKGIC